MKKDFLSVPPKDDKYLLYKMSDQYHLLNFVNTKFTKFIYIPLIGTLLFLSLFKRMVVVNLVDRGLRYRYSRAISLRLSMHWVLFIPITIAIILLLFIWPVTRLEMLFEWKLLYISIPFLVALVSSPFFVLFVVKNIAKILEVDKNIKFASDFKPYRNSQILNNENYFKILAKSVNKKQTTYFLSENLKSINENEVSVNYTYSKVDEIREVRPYIGDPLNPLSYIKYKTSWNQQLEKSLNKSFPLSNLFNYFNFLSNLNQKAINDQMINLSKKLSKLITINWIIDVLISLGLFIFLSSIYTSFSYLPSIPNTTDIENISLVSTGALYEVKNIILHYVYCLVFVISFAGLSIVRNWYVKTLAVKLCQQEYIRNFKK
ncbi:hypothetical protein [Mycoplasmopsis agassizii]|uniref:Uncharacterized protein n=1 Tax=Mycoplasmopsis agassizii TaxID=33922 RepID=A0ABX4H495_9BACT|nr:hypothetical protein [Mycoplasmopsis agassizii]PAF54709.1 hypothetical protein CJF60_03140 [Mycoplasmopsis agassizii]SMC15967.1 hypothetical protein SAMN02745179_00174 [Mycoplasmopsis agassizii]